MFDELPDITDIISWKLVIPIIILCVIRQYLKGAQFVDRISAKQKVVVVTGPTVGIGKQIIRELNYRGAKVWMGCRDVESGHATVKDLFQQGCSPDRLNVRKLDLCSFDSIRDFVSQLKEREDHVDILINNAGVMMIPRFKLSEDAHEVHWQTNYLGHFYLTELLLPLLKASAEEARIVNVSCPAHFAGDLDPDKHLVEHFVDKKENYDSRAAFSRSKLAMVMHARHLTKVLRTEGSHVTANACSPGLCYTRHFRHTPLLSNSVLCYTLAPLVWFFLKTPKDGAQTPLFCALEPKLSGVSGKYFSGCKEVSPSHTALNDDICEALYNYSCEQIS